jgi:Domain of unknown function (DUF4352)
MAQGPPQQPPEGWQRPPQQPGWGPPPGQQPPQPQPPPPQGPPAWGAPPPPRPPSKRLSAGATVALSVVGILVVLGIIGAIAGEDPAQQSAPSPTAATQPPETAPADTAEPETTSKPATTEPASDLRKPVRDGQFEFVVNSVKCGRRTVGSSGLDQTAQGQFCLVAVRVSNIGNEARTFDSSSQYLFDAGGRRFETDEATLYIEDFGKAFLENINPGNRVNGTLVYDVPRSGFKAARMELHDSPFSGGVEVQL